MSSARALCELRTANFQWPREVKFLENGYSLTWTNALPNRNVVTPDGKYATVIFAGHGGDPKALEKIDQRARQTLGGRIPEPEHVLSEDEERARRRLHYAQVPRLCVLYGTAAGAAIYTNPQSTTIALPAGASPVDISVPAPRKQDNGGAQA